jgi:hypothetical protein
MKSKCIYSLSAVRDAVAVMCIIMLAPGDYCSAAQTQQTQTTTPNAPSESKAASEKIPPEQLDSLVAPIALYPDPLLAQTLAASTYPLEIVQLQQWLEKNKNLKDKALVEAVEKQPWDPSIQAMAALPEVVKRLAGDIQWTTDLGNAFLAQQSEVMDAVQRMRKKAQEKGTLKSTEQQKVETKVVESKQVIIVEQANPEVVYVPSYNPTVVYGAAYYPYPPIYNPPPGYYAAGMALSFGVGVAMGAAWGGGWGWGASWGGNNDITINRNNSFNRTASARGATNVRGGGTWQHNPQHRGAAPYANRTTANRYGGTARGDSLSNRQASARQTSGNAGFGDRSGGGGSFGNRSAGGGGSRDLSSRSSSGSSSGFGGGSGGFSGSSARASSSRGASSMGSRGGGGRGGGRRR